MGQLDSLPFADRMITDGSGGRMHRRGIAPRQEHDDLKPEGVRHRLDAAWPLRHSDGLRAVAIAVVVVI